MKGRQRQTRRALLHWFIPQLTAMAVQVVLRQGSQVKSRPMGGKDSTTSAIVMVPRVCISRKLGVGSGSWVLHPGTPTGDVGILPTRPKVCLMIFFLETKYHF